MTTTENSLTEIKNPLFVNEYTQTAKTKDRIQIIDIIDKAIVNRGYINIQYMEHIEYIEYIYISL